MNKPISRVANCWVFSPVEDIAVFVFPVLFAWIVISLVRALGLQDIPYGVYLLSVVLLDLGHVYSTLFRTYLDPEEFSRRKRLYLLTPCLCFIIAVVLYRSDNFLFFRAYMYLNIYHLIRQQYGWMMYSIRREQGIMAVDRLLDKIMIYNATLYPLIWWHLHDIGFQWRAPNAYISLPAWLDPIALWAHWSIIVLYVLRQIYLMFIGRPVNLAKYIICLTTWLAWFPGIVIFGSSLVFFLSQTLLHGIPYLHLIFRYGRKRSDQVQSMCLSFFRGKYSIFFFLAITFCFGKLAERFDHIMNHTDSSGLWAGLLFPLLLLPAICHYVLDGFIWKMRDSKNQQLEKLLT